MKQCLQKNVYTKMFNNLWFVGFYTLKEWTNLRLKQSMYKCFTCLLLIFGSVNVSLWQVLNEIFILCLWAKKRKSWISKYFGQRTRSFIIIITVIPFKNELPNGCGTWYKLFAKPLKVNDLQNEIWNVISFDTITCNYLSS